MHLLRILLYSFALTERFLGRNKNDLPACYEYLSISRILKYQRSYPGTPSRRPIRAYR